MLSFEAADELYYKKLLFKVATILVIIGSINWLLIGIFDFNLVSGVFGDGVFTKLIYILVGISAISIMFDRDTYLPFLGPMVAPCSVLQDRTPPGATRDVKIKAKPYSKVLYWASEPKSDKLTKINTWKEAYLHYDNAGVTTANVDGLATLRVREPQSYNVPIRGTIEPHVHYRVCGKDGWMDRIQTVFVKDNSEYGDRVEGFQQKIIQKSSNNAYKFDISDTAASIY